MEAEWVVMFCPFCSIQIVPPKQYRTMPELLVKQGFASLDGFLSNLLLQIGDQTLSGLVARFVYLC